MKVVCGWNHGSCRCAIKLCTVVMPPWGLLYIRLFNQWYACELVPALAMRRLILPQKAPGARTHVARRGSASWLNSCVFLLLYTFRDLFSDTETVIWNDCWLHIFQLFSVVVTEWEGFYSPLVGLIGQQSLVHALWLWMKRLIMQARSCVVVCQHENICITKCWLAGYSCSGS